MGNGPSREEREGELLALFVAQFRSGILEVTEGTLEDEVWPALAKALSWPSALNLREIHLSNCGLTAWRATLILNTISSQMLPITTLSLSHNDLAGSGLAIKTLITSTRTLETLNLRKCQLSSSVREIFEALRYNSTLRSLDLSENDMPILLSSSAKGIKSINLRTLILQNCMGRWVPIGYLGGLLEAGLQKLDLTGNTVDYEDAMILARAAGAFNADDRVKLDCAAWIMAKRDVLAEAMRPKSTALVRNSAVSHESPTIASTPAITATTNQSMLAVNKSGVTIILSESQMIYILVGAVIVLLLFQLGIMAAKIILLSMALAAGYMFLQDQFQLSNEDLRVGFFAIALLAPFMALSMMYFSGVIG